MRLKKFLIVLFSIMLSSLIFLDVNSQELPLILCKNTTSSQQAKKFLRDRNVTQDMIDCVDFVYSYCEKVGVDATLIIAMSSIETGYGKSHLCRVNNNVGGMKASRGGWMKFSSLEEGYKTMINKIAVMAGAIKSNSYYYNTCKYIRDLGSIYWVENGCDYGYYSMLIRQMNRIKAYKVEENVENKEVNNLIVEERKEVDVLSKRKEVDNKKELSPKDYLMSFVKNKSESGMDLINRILNSAK